MKPEWRVFIERVDFDRGVRVFAGVERQDGEFDALLPPQMQRHDGSTVAEPLIGGQDGKRFVQALVDAAWAAGIRPSFAVDNAEPQIKALSAHLQDMRAVAFYKIGAPKP